MKGKTTMYSEVGKGEVVQGVVDVRKIFFPKCIGNPLWDFR